MRDLNLKKMPSIFHYFKEFNKYKCNFTFLLKRIIVEILWQLEQRANKRLDNANMNNIDERMVKRTWYCDDDVFSEATIYARLVVGKVQNCNQEEKIEYYFHSLTYLYGRFIESWFKYQLTKFSLLV